MSTLLASIFRPRLATGILATFLSAACLPTASAESFTAVDLYTLTGPAGITTVQASGSPQSAAPGGGVVGYGSGTGTGGNYHALLWNGTPVATDLHPTNLAGFTTSFAYGTSGTQQVGYGRGTGTGNQTHALLWNGTSVATDLNDLLTLGYTNSYAYSLDASGNVFGTAIDASGNTHAIEWVAVPEPAGLTLMTLGAGALLARKRRCVA